MSDCYGLLRSTEFRFESTKDAMNDPRLEIAAACYPQPLEIHEMEDGYVFLTMQGQYPSLQTQRASDEYYCIESKKWIECEEIELEFNLPEFIKSHIHPDDVCVVIVSSNDSRGKCASYEKAVITSESIEREYDSAGFCDRYKSNNSLKVSPITKSTNGLTLEIYNIKETAVGASFYTKFYEQKILCSITSSALQHLLGFSQNHPIKKLLIDNQTNILFKALHKFLHLESSGSQVTIDESDFL